MSVPFLITGLPRSRTAWMARAASIPGRSFCVHEPLCWLPRWDWVFKDIWGYDHPFDFFGVSDHGFGFHLPAIMERLAPRTLIIERPIAEVEASWERLTRQSAGRFCEVLAEYLAFEHTQIKRVAYADLGDTDAVVACLEWLMPSVSVDRDRIDRLQRVNIQVDIRGVMQAAEAR